MSDHLALSFLRNPSWHIPLKLEELDGSTGYLIAPAGVGLDRLRDLIEQYPRIVSRLRIASPAMVREAVFKRLSPLLAGHAKTDLFDRFPSFSARIVANAWQGSVWGAALVAFPAAIWLAPMETWTTLHCFLSFFFLGCIALRLAAWQSPVPRIAAVTGFVPASDLPVYSVLVALYDEAEIVGELVAALRRIAWPKSKLDIKLVCEEDDAATLGALADLALPGNFEIVRVPGLGPRTKPKALAFALPLARGEFVVLYDAEDRPDPMQLVEAWQKFGEAGPNVGCIQAPLEVPFRQSGIVPRMFAFEYATLFRGLLPWLARRRLLLPLGGTSNHFRRAVLEEVGGWDPYNVTEDADLGVRLARFGYRTETVTSPTYEPAPDTLATWLPQRTRWFKGWMQTWLVHMRDPLRSIRDLGLGSFLVAQILFAGMVLSALAHPFLVVSGFFLAVDLAFARPMGVWKSALLGVDVVNVTFGYLSFLLLGWQVLQGGERKSFWKIVLLTPVYWMMMSAAAWRAVWQLLHRPHHWEKTPHPATGLAADLPG